MSYLERVMDGANREGDRVIGTLLSPPRVFSEVEQGTWSADELTEVVASFGVGGREVLVTRMGAILVRPPDNLSDPYGGSALLAKDLEAKVAFQAEAAELFNVVLCELALRSGVVSLPAVSLDMAYGRLIEGHAGLRVSGSVHLGRTIGPFVALRHGQIWSTSWERAEALAAAASLEWAQALASVSPTLPRFTLAAYSSFMLHEHAEALLMGWIVVEQLLDELWTSYVARLGPAGRRHRLKDSRTYTAAVRTEVLATAGELDVQVYDWLNVARGHRNKLAHRAEATDAQAAQVLRATVAMLDRRLGATVERPPITGSITW